MPQLLWLRTKSASVLHASTGSQPARPASAPGKQASNLLARSPTPRKATPTMRGRLPRTRCLRRSGHSGLAFWALVRPSKQAPDGRPRQQQAKDQRGHREETTEADAITEDKVDDL